ncbi:MAG: hypothetical protein ACRCS3_00795 [Paracoccaceae bacterium]
MPHLHAVPVTLMLVTALSACQLSKPRVEAPPTLTPANPVSGEQAPLPVAQPASPAPVPASRAVALLDAVCGASLPNFGTVDAAARASGFVAAAGGNTLRSASEEVSIRLADGPGDGKTCAMTFASTDAPDAVKAAFTTLGAFKDTPLGLATKYRGRPAIFIYDGPGQQVGGAQYYTVRLLSER